MRTFAELLSSTAVRGEKDSPKLRVVFQGKSEWLKKCESAVHALPCLREEGAADVVVTDSGEGPGWHFSLNGRRLSDDLREFFWHANRGAHPIELALHSRDGIEGRLRIPPIPGFYWREQHAAAIEAAPAMLIPALLRRAGYQLRPAEPATSAQPASAQPSALALNWFRAKKIARSQYMSLPFTTVQGRWSIALHRNAGGSIPNSGWEFIEGFPGHEAADPFLASHAGQHYLLFEDVPPANGRGRLAAMRAFDFATQPEVILEKPYHLSYPCVFEHGGDWWMIPESSENSTVDLYRARRFPFEWEHERTLIDGAKLVDTTPLFHNGLWYFHGVVAARPRLCWAAVYGRGAGCPVAPASIQPAHRRRIRRAPGRTYHFVEWRARASRSRLRGVIRPRDDSV